MYCISCGEKLPENARFCMTCGTRVPESAIDLPLATEKASADRLLVHAQSGPLSSDQVAEAISLSIQANSGGFADELPSLTIFQDAQEVRGGLRGRWLNDEDRARLLALDFHVLAADGVAALLPPRGDDADDVAHGLSEHPALANWLDERLIEDAILCHMVLGFEPDAEDMSALDRRVGAPFVKHAVALAVRSYDSIADQVEFDRRASSE